MEDVEYKLNFCPTDKDAYLMFLALPMVHCPSGYESKRAETLLG